MKEKILEKLKDLVVERKSAKLDLLNKNDGINHRFTVQMDRISREMMGLFELLCDELEYEARLD